MTSNNKERCIKEDDFDSEIVSRDGKLVLIGTFSEVKLYELKDLKQIFGSKRFKDLTEELLGNGDFTYAHYIQPSEKSSSLWTQKGLDVLKEKLLISYSDEIKFTTLFHYLRESIGERPMARSITTLHNSRHPEERIEEISTLSFISDGWGNLSKKCKDRLLLVTSQMTEIKDQIMAGEFYSEDIREKIDYNEWLTE